MTMQLTRRLRRLALFGLIAVGSLTSAAVTRAGEIDGGSGPGMVNADWCFWGSHDSAPIMSTPSHATKHDAPEITNPRPLSRTSSNFDTSLAAIAATATAKTGISLEQIVEPFAMVGTYRSDSAAQIADFQSWWEIAKTTYAQYQSDLQQKLDQLALEEPLDTNVDDELNRVFATTPPSNDGPATVASTRDRVGSAAVVVTIEEPYFPYDLARRDLRQWLPRDLTPKPFCLRGRVSNGDTDSMWTIDRSSLATSAPTRSQAELLQASAECLIDEWFWKVERALDEGSTLRQAMSPGVIGQELATLIRGHERLAAKTSTFIARVWRETPAKPGAARQLLARAEAVEVAPVDAPLPGDSSAPLPSDSSIAIAASEPVNLSSIQEQLDVASAWVRDWIAEAQMLKQDWFRIADSSDSNHVAR